MTIERVLYGLCTEFPDNIAKIEIHASGDYWFVRLVPPPAVLAHPVAGTWLGSEFKADTLPDALEDAYEWVKEHRFINLLPEVTDQEKSDLLGNHNR